MADTQQSDDAGWDGRDRRAAVRLAADATARVYVLDDHGQPVARLIDATLIDVSATGLSLSAALAAPHHTRLRIDPPDGPALTVAVVAVSCWIDQPYRMHCRVLDGAVPARWVAGWARHAA
jgi:hypothetical protein